MNAPRLAVLIPLLAAGWWGILEFRRRQLSGERQIVFDDTDIRDFELLNLDA